MAHEFPTTTCDYHWKSLPEQCRTDNRCCWYCESAGKVPGCPYQRIWETKCPAKNLRHVVFSVACEVKRKDVAALTDEELTYCMGLERVTRSKSKMKLIEAEARKRWGP